MCTPKKGFLNKAERSALYNEQRREKDKRLADRIRSILLLDEGWSYEQVAKALFLDHTTVRRYLTIYSEKGLNELLALHYSGKDCELSQKQLEIVSNFVEKNAPSSVAEVVK